MHTLQSHCQWSLFKGNDRTSIGDFLNGVGNKGSAAAGVFSSGSKPNHCYSTDLPICFWFGKCHDLSIDKYLLVLALFVALAGALIVGMGFEVRPWGIW